MLWMLIFGAILLWAPPAAITHRTNYERLHGQINPKPCSVNGIEGTCMFVYECLKTEGRSVGMCVDNFMFGSCCSHNISANHLIPQTTHPNVLYSQHPTHSSLRPPSPTYNTKPISLSGSSLSSLSSKVKPSKPVPFVTRTTKKPPTKTTSTTTRSPPIVKPWTKKPTPFVTSSSSSDKHHTSLKPSSSTHRPVSSSPSGGSHTSSSHAYSSVYDLIATSKPTTKNSTWTSSLPSSSTSPPFTMEIAESASTWVTSKPGWSAYNSHNELFTTSQSSKPEIFTSGKPSSYVSRPSWQSSTENFFVTRPRPSSNLSQRPRPTRRPVTESSAVSSFSSLVAESSTAFSSSSSSSSTTTTTTSTTTTTTSTTTSTEAPLIVTTFGSSLPSTTLIPGLANYHYSGECGIAALSPRPEMRIVGGKNAAFGGWPWQVSVRRTSFFGFSSTHRCGGALINENWIATAGHCVDDLLTSQIRIRVGEYDFSSDKEPLPFVERAVAKKIVHPKYNFYTYEYDLALVKLETTLEFQPHISPICLPASDDLLIGENATVTGWGRLSEGGTLPSVLQQVSVPIVSNEKCKSMFLRAGRHEFIPEIFLCAGYDTGGQDSCQGDSGGPLQVKGKNGRYFLAGIISWGIGCAEANLPGVCTRISKFVPWILENVT